MNLKKDWPIIVAGLAIVVGVILLARSGGGGGGGGGAAGPSANAILQAESARRQSDAAMHQATLQADVSIVQAFLGYKTQLGAQQTARQISANQAAIAEAQIEARSSNNFFSQIFGFIGKIFGL